MARTGTASRTETANQIAARVIETEARALAELAGNLPPAFPAVVDTILAQTGRVIVSGMGKSGHVARKIAATLASTGTPALFVHPAEASHGDLGMVARDDVVLCLSNSGETTELSDIIAHTRRFSIPLIAITKNPASTLGRAADHVLQLPDAPEACAIGMAPTTSTTLSVALGDAIAVTLMQLRGFERESFLMFHPGGRLGAQLLRVAALMHRGEEMPLVSEATVMGEAIMEITTKGFGIAGVIEGGKLVGVITDGDIRRNLDGLLERSAGEVASRTPLTIAPDALASEALASMNAHKVTALFAVAPDGRPEGILHLHDCLRAGVA